MRAIRVAPLALLGTAALTLLAPPAAHAAPDGAINTFNPTITPSVVAPGGRVTLGGGGCTGETTVTSGIFDTTVIPSGSTTATATVDTDARRGAVYAVTFSCGSTGTTRNVNLTITAGATVTPTTTPTTTPTVSSTAIAPSGVRGGLGGSAGTTDTVQIAAGAALVLAAATGTLYFARRRSTGRRH
ncbi:MULTISPECIES: hypothetical protein [Streptomyces]|uniref:hypothetical protein n=1 Tax=Streptomyces TaxID=1883 RepID=UPI0010404B0A|nr:MULTISPECIES: hypothetical protein [Streptomyces]MBT3074744.1 hypothetical protein [Streptomyces sp. COG21]MBT3081796.1 hypothetical protein [Streptomyces sp. COG20]MBT3090682.1 hypothetical protein [Streptomyces sp. CYG21]MBT3098060.1 hypothetical protein [Streptomyces sp. CBG30]MBT3105725.1 hypothetical protein [Streptomyces sp. COG19]